MVNAAVATFVFTPPRRCGGTNERCTDAGSPSADIDRATVSIALDSVVPPSCSWTCKADPTVRVIEHQATESVAIPFLILYSICSSISLVSVLDPSFNGMKFSLLAEVICVLGVVALPLLPKLLRSVRAELERESFGKSLMNRARIDGKQAITMDM